MKTMCIGAFWLATLFSSVHTVKAQPDMNAVWQWSVAVDGHLDHNTNSRAFLWIPENCEKIRGFILAQNNMEEEMILENPVFRRAMADLGFAEVWVSPFFDHLFRFNQGAGDIFNQMVKDLAEVSGYAELRYAPVVTLGHSAAASWPYYFAAWNPGRTLAAISVSGQWPYFRNPVFAPDIWTQHQNIDFIPSLETMGEYENAESWATEGLKQRAEHPRMPLSMLACPGEGHFASTDKKVAYLALYIKKAADYRLPETYPLSAAPRLRPVDPVKSGWLVPRWKRDSAFDAMPAPVGQYKGDPVEAFWFFDEEMAMATIAYETDGRGKKPAFIEYVQNNQVVPLTDTHQLIDLKFKPKADGISFDLSAKFADTVPGGSRAPEKWTKLPKGHRLRHPESGIPIKIQPIWGQVALSAKGFAVRFKRGMRIMGGHLEAWFLASHPGDLNFKSVGLQSKMNIPLENKDGKPQCIQIVPIADQIIGTASVQLHGHSSAGLPVHYFVREGPAVIKGSTLIFTEIPPRSRLPIKITVVAWQYGTSVEPKVQTAKQVAFSFNLHK
ncbi:hypothetical protein [Arachidicoccus terrestris]|uniref:hypothetical protein n=1 Tax=Arachidicoccus terrestris TaxID=2875539 RepID=UPI001CC4C6E6|nr:hypothetical protein [Arachidicoccus terrestris]UAY56031.1 hypothetical protein K9M52_03090 [Arachidicoccus terrestris]